MKYQQEDMTNEEFDSMRQLKESESTMKLKNEILNQLKRQVTAEMADESFSR